MADFYKQRDVQALLKHRKILFLGDSNVRPLYKDLISALKRKELISVETLRKPNVESYCGDITLQQCGRKSEWTFWENRIFEEGPWRIEMFFTGRVLITEILYFISKLREVPSSIPDVVYVSFNFSPGKNTRTLVSKLLVDLKMKLPCSTLVLVGSSFPTAKDMFGDPRFDEVPFFTMGTLSRDEETEEEIIGKASSLGFYYLNIAHYLHKNVFRGMTTEHGWESVIVRYTTFLLLTYIANSLLIKTPNRVNQDVLRKAISSGNNETELYNNLLMKRANDWTWVKSKSLTEVMDLTASNAYEITQMLWKIYHRSRSHTPTRTLGRKRTRRSHHRTETKDNGYSRKTSSSPKPGSSKGEKGSKGRGRNTVTTSTESASCSDSDKEDVDAPRETREAQKKGKEKPQCWHTTILPTGQLKLGAMEVCSRINNRSSIDANLVCGTTKYDEQGGNSTLKDEESLEEGEIPESPIRGSSKEQGLIQADLNDINMRFSDGSSFEGEIDIPTIPSAISERVRVPNVAPYYQYYQHRPSPYGYHNYQNYQIQVPNYTAATQQIQCLDLASNEPVITIEVSDEEPVQEEKLNDNVADDEAIINPNSEEESRDDKSLHNERVEQRQLSPHKGKRTERCSKYGCKNKLRLMNEEGTAISWPSDKARSGQDSLWKWWRSHIQHNNGLIVLCHSGIGKIYGAIPSLNGKKGTCIAVPKIVDDMEQFLMCLEETEFPVNLYGNGFVYEISENSNEKSVKIAKLLPLAEELSRGSVKKINFEISKKKILSETARVTIKEFASFRNLSANTRQKSDSDIPSEPKASSSSNYYSYGEPMSSRSMLSTDKARAPPVGQWISSKTDTGKSKAKSPKILTESSESQNMKRSSSTNSDRRREEKSSSYETRTKRRWERTSSSSDRSDSRDQSPSERHRYRHQGSTDHRSRIQARYHWYRKQSHTDGSDDSSRPRRK